MNLICYRLIPVTAIPHYMKNKYNLQWNYSEERVKFGGLL
jgi:hypothetical protein